MKSSLTENGTKSKPPFKVCFVAMWTNWASQVLPFFGEWESCIWNDLAYIALRVSPYPH